MRLTAEHRFAAPADAVRALLVDPAFHRDLDLPDVALLEAEAGDGDGGRAAVRLRYEFVGSLDPLARRLLGRHRLTWTQHLELDPGTGEGSLRFAADADPRRLHGRADLAVLPDDGGSVRRIDGELVVAVPVVGGSAERRILPGLLRRLDIEAGRSTGASPAGDRLTGVPPARTG